MGGGLYVGLMSGTSLDGVDGVVVDFGAGGDGGLHVVAHAHRDFPPALAEELLVLNAPGSDELHRAALAANALARCYAGVVDTLFAPRPGLRHRVDAIGVHGQTVRHCPKRDDGIGYTLQLNNPALLAELSGIDVVADFRSRDLAAGGEGAPLAPAFHRTVFRRGDAGTLAVLNLGGIANLTVLRADGSTLGFDCGPANALLDAWCRRHTGAAFDAGGAWGAAGRVVPSLLDQMLRAPYFAAAPPKSTGRDLFHSAWLAGQLDAWQRASAAPAPPPRDVQATLAELTAAASAADLRRHAPEATELIVCGGGALNTDVMRRIAARLPGVRVVTSDARGLPVDQVEACAFAWLAREFKAGRPIDLNGVTGARGARRLGALYPAV